jgi:hypothetical protein
MLYRVIIAVLFIYKLSTCSLTAAVLDFLFLVQPFSIYFSIIEQLDLENTGVAL